MRVPVLPRGRFDVAPAKRVASKSVLGLATIALLASGLITPVAAQSRAVTDLTSAHHTNIARTIGIGTRVNARRAARDASNALRVHVELRHPRVDLGARGATKVASASVRNLAGTTRGGSLADTPRPTFCSANCQRETFRPVPAHC